MSRDDAENWLPGMPLALSKHVHVCTTLSGSVLLDLGRDKYLGLGREETELLAAAVSEWPKPIWDGARISLGSESERLKAVDLCRSLRLDGVLVPQTYREVGIEPAPRTDMRREWISIGDELESHRRVGAREIARFCAAFLWARSSLVCRPLLATVESMRALKLRSGVREKPAEVAEVTEMVGVFRTLRPFVFAAEGRCLLHALTLARFLGAFGFHPDWIIGVATQPWAAHSWVQWGDFLLDSNPEKVCRFTPILVV